MIITQGYPLWAVVSRPDGTADAEPVVAWLMDEPHEASDGRQRVGPLVPISPAGLLDPGTLGSYLTSQEAVDKFLMDFEHARGLARLAKVGKEALTIEDRPGKRAGGAKF
jgi:hypothetical protein